MGARWTPLCRFWAQPTADSDAAGQRATVPPSVMMGQLAGLALTIVFLEVALWLPRRLGLLL